MQSTAHPIPVHGSQVRQELLSVRPDGTVEGQGQQWPDLTSSAAAHSALKLPATSASASAAATGPSPAAQAPHTPTARATRWTGR